MYKAPQNPTFENLLELSKDLSQILDTVHEGILLTDQNAIVLFANKALGRFLQIDHEQMIGQNFSRFIQAEETGLLEQLHKELENAIPGEFNTACFDRKKSGHRIEIIYGRPKHKKPPNYFFFRDITRRANIEEELRHRNAFLNGLIESSVDGIIAADMKGNIILFNKGAQNLLGYTEQEALESLHTTKLYTEGTAHEIMRKMRMEEFGGMGKCLKHRVIGLNKDGQEIPISLSGSIIYDADGNESANFGIFTDQRQVEEMQQCLRDKQMELIKSEKMASLGRLSAGVAHEINNPLSGVLIYANLVLEELDGESQIKTDIERIISETTRCKGIVRELLDFARQDASSSEMIDINTLLQEGIHLIKNQAIFHNVEITLDFASKLPPVAASGARLSQVFLNLYLNAAEAMKGNGRLTIKTSLEPYISKVRTEVSDTGCGIKPEIQSKIFEPFFTTKEIGKGTGLGLSVSYGIIQECGGNIEVYSELDKGATFIIDLPIYEAHSLKKPSEAL